MKKKILFICAGHSLDDERVTRKEAVSLANLGYDVTVCAQTKRSYAEPKIRMVDVDTLQTVQNAAATPRTKEGGRLDRIMRLRNIQKLCLTTKPDLIVAHEFETAYLAWRLHKRCGMHYVFDAHECYETTMHCIFPRILQGFAHWFFVQLLHRIIEDAMGVTTASSGSETYIYGKRCGLPTEVLHNSPMLKYFPFCEDEKGPILLVHDGNLTFERGALQILDALKIVKNNYPVKLMTLGRIPEDVLPLFTEKIDQLGIKPEVDLRGNLPWTEFGAIEATGQIGLICSQPIANHLKSLSNKLYNYMACGLAVLGMKNSETEKIINEARCGLCADTSKPEEIARMIVYLIEHPDERRQMARNGRRIIEDKYCWERMEDVMRNFYAEVFRRIGA